MTDELRDVLDAMLNAAGAAMGNPSYSAATQAFAQDFHEYVQAGRAKLDEIEATVIDPEWLRIGRDARRRWTKENHWEDGGMHGNPVDDQRDSAEKCRIAVEEANRESAILGENMPRIITSPEEVEAGMIVIRAEGGSPPSDVALVLANRFLDTSGELHRIEPLKWRVVREVMPEAGDWVKTPQGLAIVAVKPYKETPAGKVYATLPNGTVLWDRRDIRILAKARHLKGEKNV